MTPIQLYKEYSAEDKAALKELQAELKEKLGRDVSLTDMVRAVEPSLETPSSLCSA